MLHPGLGHSGLGHSGLLPSGVGCGGLPAVGLLGAAISRSRCRCPTWLLAAGRRGLLVAGRGRLLRRLRPAGGRHGAGAGGYRCAATRGDRRASGADRHGPERLLLGCPSLVLGIAGTLVLRIPELAVRPPVDRRRPTPLIGRARPPVLGGTGTAVLGRTGTAVLGRTGTAVLGGRGTAGAAVLGSATDLTTGLATTRGPLGQAGRAVPRRLVPLRGGASRRVPDVVPALVLAALRQPRVVSPWLLALHRRVPVALRRPLFPAALRRRAALR